MKLAMCCITMVVAQLCHGADTEEERRTLAGVTAIHVVVEELPAGASNLGLTQKSIATDVELKLRLAGMRVVESSRVLLYVNANLMNNLRAAHVEIELVQPVTLVRDPTIMSVLGRTWSAGNLIVNPSAQFIHDAIKDAVDKFLSAWLSVNAKR